MSTTDRFTDEPEVPPLNPDPFSLAKDVKSRLQRCQDDKAACADDIAYLWLRVTPAGIGQTSSGDGIGDGLNVEDWLNVIDEASSLGVTWLVVSLETELETVPDLWRICQWAQNTHQIQIGLHLQKVELSDAAIDAMKQLNLDMTRVLLPQSLLSESSRLEEEGIRLCAADPQTEMHDQPCKKPGQMIFVDPRGVLYTCGMVEGSDEFKLGSIFEGSFEEIVRDPERPHSVPAHAAQREKGCEGCPPLIAKYFIGE